MTASDAAAEPPHERPSGAALSARARRLLLTTLSAASGAAPPLPALPRDIGPLLADGRLRYRLHAAVASGRQASVWRAIDRLLSLPERPIEVAVKLFPRPSDPAAAAAALAEARSLRQIRHPNVVAVLDAGSTEEGWPYVIEEFIDAVDLRDWRDARPGKLPIDAALELVIDLADAAAAVHQADLVHCDIAPGNILVSRSGRAILADFGSTLASGGARDATGTPAFMPREQWFDGIARPHTDVAALAGVLHWLLSDQWPYGESTAAIESAHRDPVGASRGRRQALADAKVPAGLAAIIDRGLDADPSRRPISGGAFAEELRSWRAQQTRHRRVRRLAVGALVLLIGAVGMSLALQLLVRPPREGSASPDWIARMIGDSDPAMTHAAFSLVGATPASAHGPSTAAVATWSLTVVPRLNRLHPIERPALALGCAVACLESGDADHAEMWLGIAVHSVQRVQPPLSVEDRTHLIDVARGLIAAIAIDRGVADSGGLERYRPVWEERVVRRSQLDRAMRGLTAGSPNLASEALRRRAELIAETRGGSTWSQRPS